MTIEPEYVDKFTDRDVKLVPELAVFVSNYLAEYKGTYRFLCDVKDSWNTYGRLTEGQIRGVANCMLSDVSAVELCAEMSRLVLPVRRTDKRKYVIRLKSRIKMPYAASLHKSTRLYHLVDPRVSGLSYVTRAEEWRWHVKPYCGTSLSMGKLFGTEPPDLRPCKRCWEIYAKLVKAPEGL
jgi:hypothetical protein